MPKTYYTSTPEETFVLGIRIGQNLIPGTVIALRGGLGAGKTTLTKGIAQGLGIEETVTSPTYTLIAAYQGRLPLYHMDLYRLSSPEEFEDLGAEELMESDGISVIEWSEKAGELLPEDHAVISLETEDSEGRKRRITLENLPGETS